MIPFLAEAESDILRAASILRVRVLALQQQPWRALSARFQQCDLSIEMELLAVLKGGVDDAPGARFTMHAQRTENSSPRYSAVPGVYSQFELDELAPGAELVGFTRLLGGSAAAAMTEPACFALAPAVPAAADVAWADTRPDLEQPLAEQLAGLQTHRADFGVYFAGYLVDRVPEGFFGAGGDLDAVLDVLRAPELPASTRFKLCDGLVERIVQYSPIDESALQQCVHGLLRLLLLPEAGELHANLVQTWLPNLVGIEGSLEPHAAAQLVPEAGLRARASAAVARLDETGTASAFSAWLAA